MSKSEVASEPVVTPTTVKRISRDVKCIMKNPLHENGIYYEHNMDNIFKGYAMIVGPTDTPYQDGFYFFEISFPYDYPHSPPTLTFLSNGDNIRFNPNLYRNGKVCVSLLNTWRGEQWTSCQSISTVLLTLCTVLNENPLLNEPGISPTDREIEPYNTIVAYKNIDVCIVRMFEKIRDEVEPFALFREPCVRHFIDNKARILTTLASVEKSAIETTYRNASGDIYTNIYKMAAKINKGTVGALRSQVTALSLGPELGQGLGQGLGP